MAKDKDSEYLKQLELQRQAFEAQFGSLESMGFEDKLKDTADNSSSDSEDAESGSGSGSEDNEDEIDDEDVSDHEQGSDEEDSDEAHAAVIPLASNSTKRAPRVIKFNGPSDEYVAPSKQEQKLVRSGKTLRQLSAADARRAEIEEKKAKRNANVDDNDAENLENDIELQQFLKESHLLSAFNQPGNSSETSGAELTLKSLNDSNVAYQDDQVTGKARMRTLEMRLSNLSQTNGKSSKANRLEKVPMHIRKGMIDKHRKRIEQYERDAAEGGIILSKVKKGQFRKIESTYVKDIERRIGQSIKTKDKARSAKRERGLKIHSVGKSTRNGLIISKDDISRIGGTVGNKRKWNSSKPRGRR
ncbi:Faf1 protein [Maudiozyma humilis]|uniref:Faf1 protein n=1 Tax=Maudiozyma humilis TaxID=51915 RepID=A0AAV5RXD4_MAUHU|nr:Faf1 protein [Kazachstania humilis]